MDRESNLFEVIISERAANMLIEHMRFVAQVSPEAADKLRSEILVASRSLQLLPERFPILSDQVLPINKYRKMMINKRYCFVYQIKEQTVHIDFILDCRQDYQWLI